MGQRTNRFQELVDSHEKGRAEEGRQITGEFGITTLQLNAREEAVSYVRILVCSAPENVVLRQVGW